MKTVAFLKKDRMEHFNLKRGWFVNAWRIVDERGNDTVQPWFSTKTDARAYAVKAQIKLEETP